MPVSNVPKEGYVSDGKGKYHKPYGKGTKKGGARKGKVAGSRKAFDDTPHSSESPSAAATRAKGVTTKKGSARKGTVAGARLAYDDTKKQNKNPWLTHTAKVHSDRKKKDPSAKYSDSLKMASASYRK